MMALDDDPLSDQTQPEMDTVTLHSPPSPPPPPATTVNGGSSHSPPPQIFTISADLNSFLDPPSYADAMFRSFDLDTSLLPPSPTSSPPPPSDFIHISVSDPQKITDSGSYFTYLITTRTNLEDFDATEFNVRRRFREVVSLSERLSECYRGYFIPLRPDKSVMESQMMQASEFVEQRRVAIEKYLRKLGKHPVIRRSEQFRVFLTAEGRFLPVVTTAGVLDGVVKLPRQLMGDAAVRAQEVAQPAKGGRDLLRLFKELRQAVANDWGGARPAVVEEDREFLERKERLSDLEMQLSNLSEQAETLVKAQQDIGETMGELGLAFVKLTKFEIERAEYECQRARAADMKNVATAAVKASRLYRELNAQTVKHLDKLHDYLGMMLAVDNAFTDRSNALLTVQTLLSEVTSLQSRIEKLEVASSKIFGGDKSRMRKIEELKESLKLTEDAKGCAIREYEKIKDNNRSELARLDQERRADFLSMLKGFVVNQAGYAEKMANVWEKVAEETSGYSKHVNT